MSDEGHKHEDGFAGHGGERPSTSGHAHLRYVPSGARPALFAARADLLFDPATRPDQLESMVFRFFAALADDLTGAGCSLVGHIKGTIAAPGRGDLAFHLTTLAAPPSLTGGIAGATEEAVLTINVIVFGVAEEALPAIVRSAWSRVSGTRTAWRH